MLFRSGMDIKDILLQLLISLPAILISLSVHEYMHGYAAYRQGDMTARNMGRLTLNPIKHIDIIGFLCLLIAGFGWAKPVPINPRNFKKYKKGLISVSLAGPLSNLAMCFLGLILLRVYIFFFYNKMIGLGADALSTVILTFITYFTQINVGLFVFNLIPVPPLDGSRIVSALLPQRAAYVYLKYERYIALVLFALLYLGWLSKPISFLCGYIISGFSWILDLIPFLSLK